MSTIGVIGLPGLNDWLEAAGLTLVGGRGPRSLDDAARVRKKIDDIDGVLFGDLSDQTGVSAWVTRQVSDGRTFVMLASWAGQATCTAAARC